MEKITDKNYHSPENTAISTSKVKTFLKSKELYYRRYIECSAPSLDSPGIKTGRIIDKILEQMTLHQFKRSYTVAVKKKDDKELFEKQKTMDREKILTPANYEAIVSIADRALRSPFLEFYRDRKNKTEKQKVCIQHLDSPNHDIDICGMLDRFTISGNTAYIDDYKTSAASGIKDPMRWYYVCKQYGYFMQMAVYKWLIEEEHPEIEKVVCRHVVFGTSKFDMYPIKLFVIPNSLLEAPLELFFETVVAIKEEQNWIDKLPSWEDAEELPEEELLSEGPQMITEEEMDNL